MRMRQTRGEKEQVCTPGHLSDTDVLMIACLTAIFLLQPIPNKHLESMCVCVCVVVGGKPPVWRGLLQ